MADSAPAATRLAADLAGKRIPRASVPVVDFQPFLEGSTAGRTKTVAEIAFACRQIGFFYLAGHGVPAALVDRVLENSKRFFALPAAEKQRLHIKNSRFHRGYIGIGSIGGSAILGRRPGRASDRRSRSAWAATPIPRWARR